MKSMLRVWVLGVEMLKEAKEKAAKDVKDATK